MTSPEFLRLPARGERPRDSGLTHVLDKGSSPAATAELVRQSGHLIDIVKIGWGIGYVDPTLAERVSIYRAAGIDVSLGGTLLEVSVLQDRVEALADWAEGIGISVLEVSNGLCQLDRGAKAELIGSLSSRFRVAAETGAKDASVPVVLDDWIEEMTSDLEAGARWLVTEGRESGTVGIYHRDGAVRDEMIEAIAERLPLQQVIFEAPIKAQQAWFVRTVGPQVNLGNIPPDEVLALETLRLGLRADTALHVHARALTRGSVAP